MLIIYKIKIGVLEASKTEPFPPTFPTGWPINSVRPNFVDYVTVLDFLPKLWVFQKHICIYVAKITLIKSTCIVWGEWKTIIDLSGWIKNPNKQWLLLIET